MSGEKWVCNSENTLKAFQAHAAKLWGEHKHVTFAWRVGRDATLDQKALFHIWIRELVAHMLGISIKQVDEPLEEGAKRFAKQAFYRETGSSFMVVAITNPLTGESRKDFRSVARLTRGEMFMFMDWLQAYAAEHHGLILESKGEFEKLKREAIA